MFKSIILAYDGSDHANRALITARDLADTFGSNLHVVHTLHHQTPPYMIGSYVADLELRPTAEQIDEATNSLTEQLKIAAGEPGVTVKQTHVHYGDPANHILGVAKKTNADLIVMGRRGYGSIRSLALGSVSLSVSHGATCACLTVI